MTVHIIWSGTRAVLAAGLAIALVAASARAQDIPETKEPIRLALNEWTGQQITTHIAGSILERMGYKVEYVTAGYIPQFAALQDGDLDATLEVWSNNAQEQFNKALESGQAVSLGDLGVEAREGWGYPAHVAKLCPGLPKWKALVDCSETFATPETFPEGRILAYPADWGTRSEEMIGCLELPYVAVPGGSEGALVAEMRAAVADGKPLIMMFWSPHWVLAEVDFRWVEGIPDKCRIEDPRLFKMANAEMGQKWPAAFRLLKLYKLSAEDQIDMIAAIDTHGEDLAEVAARWVDQNEDIWSDWIAEATGQ